MEYRFPHRRVINVDSEIVEDISNDYENEDDEGEEDEESDDEEEEDDDVEDEDDEQLAYPGFVPISLKYLDQGTRPRSWCLAMITNPYPFHTKYKSKSSNNTSKTKIKYRSRF